MYFQAAQLVQILSEQGGVTVEGLENVTDSIEGNSLTTVVTEDDKSILRVSTDNLRTKVNLTRETDKKPSESQSQFP